MGWGEAQRGVARLPLTPRASSVHALTHASALHPSQVNTLNTLDEVGLTDKTLVIRTADHGEMGMAHGTLIQKNFNM